MGRLLFLLACGASAFYNTYCKFLVHPKYTELEILYTQAVGSLASIPLFLWVEPLHIATLLRLDRVAILGLGELTVIVYGA